MTIGIRRHTTLVVVIVLAVAIGCIGVVVPAMAQSETPRRGGVLLAAIAADAPSLDPHQEQTFATIQPVAPLYSTLLQIDPYSYPNVVGDVASEWKISPDGLTYTFKIRQDIRFHDGSPLTAADVKASYDKILNPPEGVRSIRKQHYSAVASVEAPDAATVVFRPKFPSASLLANLASPSNVIFPKKYLDKDPNYFKTNVMGSGPFRFKSYTRGSTFEGERNPDYFIKDRPYLNGYKFFISTETSVRAAAIRSGRAHIEFRDLPQAEVDAIRKQLADKNRAEARRLLAEAGYPNGFKVVLKNRNVKLPYQDFAVYVIQEWRKIGVEAEHRPLETAAWYAEGRDQGNFEVIVTPIGAFVDDPDQLLAPYITGSSQNWARFSNPAIDDLYARQARTLDPTERRKLVIELQKIVLENAYHMPGLWWSRNVVHWAKVKNWVAPPSHFTNQKLQDVWLSED